MTFFEHDIFRTKFNISDVQKLFLRHHDTQHNATQHNATQLNNSYDTKLSTFGMTIKDATLA
jgi:hypothetical protein